MSDLDVLKAVLVPLRESVDPVSLYTQRTGPNSLEAARSANRLTYPYGLASQGPSPGRANAFDEQAQLFLDWWGTQAQLDEILGKTEWLDGHTVGRFEDALRIRYGVLGRPMQREPDAKLPDGREVWHATENVRARYVDRSRILRPRVLGV